MLVSSLGPKGAVVSFGLAAQVFVLTPTSVGYQDLASLMAQQPAVAERFRQHLVASPFGTIHASTFTLPRPVGTGMFEPPRYQLASLDTREVTGSVDPQARLGATRAKIEFPSVDRTRKGDRLVPAPAENAAEKPAALPPVAENEPLPDIQIQVEMAIRAEANAVPAAVKTDELEAAVRSEPFLEFDISMSLELAPQLPAEEVGDMADIDPAELYPNAPPNLDGLNAEMRADHLFFAKSIGEAGSMVPWQVGQAPVLVAPRQDPDMKLAALAPPSQKPEAVPPVSGVTIAGKGEVTGEGQRPKTPAERLGLAGKARTKAERCLANAVYFESRSEPVRGQIAVAQVVLNRAFSGYYPEDVCGVVYQNAHRHLACQFTFACDGIPDRVTDDESWTRATRIAKETLDGKLWLADVGKSTHYHANYVNPWWRRSMRTLSKIGLHIFYRPRKWGDGEDAPSWGSATYTAEVAKKM